MIPAALYYPVYLYLIIVLTLFVAFKIRNSGYARIIRGDNNFIWALLLSVILAILIGMRPITGRYFGDTGNYAFSYYLMQSEVAPPEHEDEWLWTSFMHLCAQSMDVSFFFTIVSVAYFCFMLFACRRLMPNNPWVALLFNLGAFSFFSYGTNGIRNGLACSIVLFVIALASGEKKEKILAIVLGLCAPLIHKSTTLPLAMLIVSMYFIKSFKWSYSFWILSIVISLVAGGFVENFFTGLGFDDRLDSYINSAEEYAARGYKSGFRWDFLLYGMMPIVLGYYVVIKRGIQDKTYLLLLNTYTLSNAFWVMLIRASYSNRFAYLSWFMYPMVLAYPLLRLNVWGKNQGKWLSRVMLAHVGFTWFMSLI